MDAVLAKLLEAATTNGGKTTYPEFLETLDYKEQALLPRAIKLGKSKGTLKSYLVWDAVAKTNTHILEAV